MPKRSRNAKERDAKLAFVCGEAFQRQAGEIIPRISAIKEGSEQSLSNELGDVVVCATNLAFALELFIKAILVHLDLEVPEMHDLSALYKRIPDQVKAIIEDTYHAKLPEQLRALPYHRFTFATWKRPLAGPHFDDKTRLSSSLPDLLARSSNLFQSWRYLFEFSQPDDNPYQYHLFEYALLWCATEAVRVEVKVRFDQLADAHPAIPNAAAS